MKRILPVLIVLLSVALFVGIAGCSGATETTEPATDTEDAASSEPAAQDTGDSDKELVENKCSLCHTTDRVWSADYDRATWEATVDRMKANGMVVTDEEYERIVTYLSE